MLWSALKIQLTDSNAELWEIIFNVHSFFFLFTFIFFISLFLSLFQVEKTLKDQRDPGEAIFDIVL